MKTMRTWYVMLMIVLLAGCETVNFVFSEEEENAGDIQYYEDPGFKEVEGPNALWLGEDNNQCECCKGQLLVVQNDTLRFLTMTSNVRFNYYPESFPVDIYVEYEEVEQSCMGDEVVVTYVEVF